MKNKIKKFHLLILSIALTSSLGGCMNAQIGTIQPGPEGAAISELICALDNGESESCDVSGTPWGTTEQGNADCGTVNAPDEAFFNGETEYGAYVGYLVSFIGQPCEIPPPPTNAGMIQPGPEGVALSELICVLDNGESESCDVTGSTSAVINPGNADCGTVNAPDEAFFNGETAYGFYIGYLASFIGQSCEIP